MKYLVFSKTLFATTVWNLKQDPFGMQLGGVRVGNILGTLSENSPCLCKIVPDVYLLLLLIW